jgi:hypothetical protein
MTMWHFWSSLICFQVALCAASWQEPTAVPPLAAPAIALSQQQPQPPEEIGEQPQATPEKGQQKGGRRRRSPGNRGIEMGPQEPSGPEEPSAQREEIEPPTGPMRVEPFLVTEERVRYVGEVPEQAAESSLRLHVKLTGERLGKMVGLGQLIIAEMVDDTGAVLASPEEIDPRDEKATSPIRSSDRLLARGFVNRSARTKAPSRAARKLSRVSGWVNVVYATETEDILIDNPLQYLGGYLEHPRLKELNMKIRVIQPGEEINVRREGRGIALQFEGGRKRIQQIEFFDAWLKPLYPRPRTVQTPDGEEYVYYGSVMGPIDADTQMLLTVYPEIEEEKVRFEFKDLELP